MESTLTFQAASKINHDFDDSTKGRALYKVIFGIAKEWNLSGEELATLLARSPTTISEWKNKETISISKTLSPNDYQILEFIELYKILTSLFVSIADRASWIRDKNLGLGNKSPLDLTKEDPRNLGRIKDVLGRVANP